MYECGLLLLHYRVPLWYVNKTVDVGLVFLLPKSVSGLRVSLPVFLSHCEVQCIDHMQSKGADVFSVLPDNAVSFVMSIIAFRKEEEAGIMVIHDMGKGVKTSRIFYSSENTDRSFGSHEMTHI